MTSSFGPVSIENVAPMVLPIVGEASGHNVGMKPTGFTANGDVICENDKTAQLHALGRIENAPANKDLKSQGLIDELPHFSPSAQAKKSLQGTSHLADRYAALTQRWTGPAQSPHKQGWQRRDYRSVMYGKKPPSPNMRPDQKLALNAFRLARKIILEQPTHKIVSVGHALSDLLDRKMAMARPQGRRALRQQQFNIA